MRTYCRIMQGQKSMHVAERFGGFTFYVIKSASGW